MTPHIHAEKKDIAQTVLMPGDPLRAKFIAETYLTSPRLVNTVRNMYAYTGLYKDKELTVMGHGMGMPSCAIYVHELFDSYDVQQIIRVGSCGAVKEEVKVRDIVLGMGACTDSKTNRQRFMDNDFAPIADFGLLSLAKSISDQKKIDVKIGNLFSADLFYTPNPDIFKNLAKYGILGVEMEAAAIYAIAAEFGRKALAICTVSDHIVTGESTSSDERQSTFTQMMEIALETAYLAK